MATLPKIKNFQRHVVLYAKHHYGKSAGPNHVFDDLGALLKEYAGLPEDGSMWDVYDCIVGAFTEYVRPQDQYETLTHLFFNRSNFVTVRELAERMVGMIACIEIKDKWDLDMTLLNARFGDKAKKLEASHA